jgi:hypothetical protein
MKRIPLTQGLFALVDDSDYERVVAAGPWHAIKHRKTYYARHTLNGGQSPIKMHRLIMGVEYGVEVDHKDLNGLNNSRLNLRVATTSQNCQNRGLKSTNTSGFIGVSWHKATGKWQAYINKQGKRTYLGLFDDLIQAVNVRDTAAREFHGEFARTNKSLGLL